MHSLPSNPWDAMAHLLDDACQRSLINPPLQDVETRGLTDQVRIIIPGEPCAKGRPRFGKGRAYTPAKTVKWEQAAAWAARMQYGNLPPVSDALQVRIVATFGIPKSWPKWKQGHAEAGTIPHRYKPDSDNILKAVGDALSGVVWLDDAQIVEATVIKCYGLEPSVTLTVGPAQ